MAWALQFDGVNDYATLDSAVSFADTGEYSISLSVKLDAAPTDDINTLLYLDGNNYLYYRQSNTRFYWKIAGSNVQFIVPTVDVLGVDVVIHLQQTAAGGKTISVDGIGTSSPFTTLRTFSFDRFVRTDAWRLAGQLSEVVVYSDIAETTAIERWSATASSHTAGTPVLLNTITSNNATGVNMPTDGSAWVWDSAGETPWALEFDGVNDHSLLGAAISISTTDDFSLRWRWPADANSGNHRVLGGINLAASSPRVILFSGGNAVLYGDAGTNKSFPASIDTSVDRVVEFRRASGQLGLYYDNVLQGAAQASTQSFTSFSTLGGNFGTSTIASKLQTLEIDVAGSPVIALDATASSHASGTPILTDTIGANNATGVNMPTDGSAWIDLTPWALQFDGVNDLVNIASPVTIGFGNDGSISVPLKRTDTSNGQALFGDQSGTNNICQILNASQLFFRVNGSSITFNLTTSLVLDGEYVFKFKRVSNTWSLVDEFDSSLAPETVGNNNTVTINQIGAFNGGTLFHGRMDGFIVEELGIELQSLINTTGTGSTWPDSIGSADGALVSFPTDDSQWIDLGGGGENNVSSAFNLSALSFAAVIDNPSTGNNVSSAFNLSALSFAAVLDNTPIENNVSSAFNLSPLSFAAVIDNTSTGNSVSSAFNLSPLSFSAVLDNTPIENSVSSAFNLSPLSFAAVIDNSAAGNSVSSAFSLSALQFASVIDNTPIENSVSSAFNLSPLSFAVRVQNGELVAIVIETNSIVQSNYSRTIIQPTYSTNIKGK